MGNNWSLDPNGELHGPYHDGLFLGITAKERHSVKLNIRDEHGVDYLFHLTGSGVARVNEFWEENLISYICIDAVDTLSPELIWEVYKGRIRDVEEAVRELKRSGATYLLQVYCDCGTAAYVTFSELQIEKVD